jgi:hypothetical protein
MRTKHKVRIRIADKHGNTQTILESRRIKLPKRLLTLFFGNFSHVLILTPGETVQGVEIHELHDDAQT